MPRDPDAPWRRSRKKTPEPHVDRIQKRMARGQTLAQAADGLGIPLWLAKAVFVRSGLPLPKVARPRPRPRSRSRSRAGLGGGRRQRPTDLSVLLALRIFAHELGAQTSARGPVHVTMTHWDRRRDPKIHPASQGVVARFGSWEAACRAAGVPVLVRRSPTGRRARTDEECLAAVRLFLSETTDGTSGEAYIAWARGRDVPACATVVARFGGWPNARDLARG